VLDQLPKLAGLKTGLAHFFLQHTSASLSINENADVTVRTDMEAHFNRLAPEDAHYLEYVFEGPDDMPAHIKSALLGSEFTIPVHAGQLQFGTWQGIYLGEHRNAGGPRRVLVTLQGDTR
jgi:secondary thiamine-phosphate synthase enzyme